MTCKMCFGADWNSSFHHTEKLSVCCYAAEGVKY